jgi:hypothetical protein
MSLSDRFGTYLGANISVIFLLVLLAVSVYGNYKHSWERDRVCELLGSYDVVWNYQLTNRSLAAARTGREEIDNICRKSDEDSNK